MCVCVPTGDPEAHPLARDRHPAVNRMREYYLPATPFAGGNKDVRNGLNLFHRRGKSVPWYINQIFDKILDIIILMFMDLNSIRTANQAGPMNIWGEKGHCHQEPFCRASEPSYLPIALPPAHGNVSGEPTFDFYPPQGKVIFSKVSVILFTEGSGNPPLPWWR